MIEKIVVKWIDLWSMSLLAYPQRFCKWETIMEACSVGGVQRRRLGYEVMRHRASLAILQIPGNYQHPSDNRRYPSVCVQSSFDACPHQASHEEPGIIVGLSSWSSTLLYSWFLNLHCLYFLILPDWPLPRPPWSRQSTKNGRNICKGTELCRASVSNADISPKMQDNDKLNSGFQWKIYTNQWQGQARIGECESSCP